jgi:hypothetical protein
VKLDEASLRLKVYHEPEIVYSHGPVHGVSELNCKREIVRFHFLHMKHAHTFSL